MAGSYPTQLNPGLSLPTTYIFDVAQLYSVNVESPEFKELLVRLAENVNNILLAVNNKDSALYPLQEFINNQTWFPDPALSSTTQAAPVQRQVYRIVVNFGALPNTATKSVPHGIDPTTFSAAWSFTRIYATASDTTGLTYIPIPYASNVAGASIELSVDATNVNITTGSNRSNYNICYVILEYIKQ